MPGVSDFDPLTGTIDLPANDPGLGSDSSELPISALLSDPADPRWATPAGGQLLRTTFRFWLLLACGSPARSLENAWRQRSEPGSLGEPAEEAAYLASLMDCWVRFWDLFSRGAATIIQEEGASLPESAQQRSANGTVSHYTAEAFDLLMIGGADSYRGAPIYRHLLEEFAGSSASAVLAFPCLAFHAMGSRSPRGCFETALRQMSSSDELRAAVDSRSGEVYLDWLELWPLTASLLEGDFEGGWVVLANGPLSGHPVYTGYPQRVRSLLWQATLTPGPTHPPTVDGVASLESRLDHALRELPSNDPRVLFALPGLPPYRQLLSQRLPPPRVRLGAREWRRPESEVEAAQRRGRERLRGRSPG